VGPLIAEQGSLQYILTYHELPLLPWGACCGYQGPASDLLGLDTAVFLLSLEVFATSPLSLLTAFLLWKRRKSGATLGTYLAVVRTRINLVAFAAPYGVIYVVQLLLIRTIRARLQ
jgi:hypothetical protein